MKPTGKMTILPLVVVCVFLSSALCFTTTTLRSLPARNVTSAEYSCPAVSTLSCARLCKGYSHCISFAFDRSAGVCHLHPVLGAGLVATPLRIYQDTDPVCKESSLTVSNSASVRWTRTLTSFQANVTCRSGYLLNTVNTVVRCMKDGQLVPTQADVQCRQYLWNNPVGDVRVPIPRNVTVGWSMCINGTPTNDFYIDIEGNSSSSLPLTTTWTMGSLLGLLNTNSLKVGDKLDGILSSLLTVISLTSFSVNAPGFIKITVISSSQLSIYVNNNLVYTMQLRFPLDDFDYVVVKGSITVSALNVWCTP